MPKLTPQYKYLTLEFESREQRKEFDKWLRCVRRFCEKLRNEQESDVECIAFALEIMADHYENDGDEYDEWFAAVHGEE